MNTTLNDYVKSKINHCWKATVRDYEVDIQGIVNNANYMHYLDQARINTFQHLGIVWRKLHFQGFDLVLAESNLQFKSPLIAKDDFKVETTAYMKGKLRIIFEQNITATSRSTLCLNAINTVVCIDTSSRKPVMPQILSSVFV